MPRKSRTHAAATATAPEHIAPAVDAVLHQAQERTEREPGMDEPPERKYPPRRGWHKHNAAGLRRHENRDTKPWQAEIEFKEKPSEALMDAIRPVLKESGFHWDKHSGEHGAWVKPIRYDTQAQDRYVAERATHDVIAIVARHKGIEVPEQGIPI